MSAADPITGCGVHHNSFLQAACCGERPARTDRIWNKLHSRLVSAPVPPFRTGTAQNTVYPKGCPYRGIVSLSCVRAILYRDNPCNRSDGCCRKAIHLRTGGSNYGRYTPANRWNSSRVRQYSCRPWASVTPVWKRRNGISAVWCVCPWSGSCEN